MFWAALALFTPDWARALAPRIVSTLESSLVLPSNSFLTPVAAPAASKASVFLPAALPKLIVVLSTWFAVKVPFETPPT